MALKEELTRASVESRVLEITRELILALGGSRALAALGPDASLERELGLGSLERVELISRLEAEFQVELPDTVLADAETPADLVDALLAGDAPARAPNRVALSRPLGTVPPPAEAETLVEVLRLRAAREPRRAHIYLQEDGKAERVLTYSDLFRSATAVAGGLARRGVEPGQTVALMLPTGADFFSAFFGALLAGAVPVPLYPPFSMDRLAEYATRQSAILASADARLLITVSRGLVLGAVLKGRTPLTDVTTVSELLSLGGPAPTVAVTADSPALIQYTSGSTGDPKGVLLTHRNLLANVRAIGNVVDIQPADVGASWLPLYHDMGLIGCWFTPLYFGIPTAILSPLSFLSRPERWLWTIHARRATLTAAPNFAFELLVRRVKDATLEGLDLSCWRAALNGAEPVLPETLERFTRRFARYGFRPESLLPVYGLAESTVALAVPPLGRTPRVERLERDAFEREGRAIRAAEGDAAPRRFVSVGRPVPGHDVRIVDAAGRELPERQEGELQFRGPSTMQGYYRNPQATAAVFKEGGWVDSGDRAFVAEGEVFITGRAKDLIIRGGRNLYPQEIESIVGELEGVRRGCVVAFGVIDTREGTEKIVVVAETRADKEEDKDRISRRVQESLSEALGAPADLVLLVPPHTVPKTSSGKLRRSACREMYLKGDLLETRRARAVLLLMRLALARGTLGLGRGTEVLGRVLYGVYFFGLAAVVVVSLWALALVSSRRSLAEAVRRGARAFFVLAGCPLRVMGREHLAEGACIVVSNHASYVDPLLLLAVLPMDFAFVLKSEAAHWPLVRTFVRKMGHVPVERLDTAQSVTDAERLAAVLKEGRSLMMFPEGTFTRATGLRPFKLGAFRLAADAQVPILPVALLGARRLLRDGNWLPRRTDLEVVIEEPRRAASPGLQDVVRLREDAAEILARDSGEPRLDLVAAGFVPKSA